MPYDGLLREMGGTGFPTLMFLDGEGRRIMTHSGPRTVKGFEKSLEEAQEFLDLAKKAEAGDDKAATEILIRQMQLGWYDLEEARTRRNALKVVSSKQEKEFDQLLIDTEVRSMIKGVGDDDEAHRAAGKHFAAMWSDKRVPRENSQRYAFWWAIAAHAEQERDKKTFKRVVGEFEDLVDDDSRYRKRLKDLEERLEDFPKD